MSNVHLLCGSATATIGRPPGHSGLVLWLSRHVPGCGVGGLLVLRRTAAAATARPLGSILLLLDVLLLDVRGACLLSGADEIVVAVLLLLLGVIGVGRRRDLTVRGRRDGDGVKASAGPPPLVIAAAAIVVPLTHGRVASAVASHKLAKCPQHALLQVDVTSKASFVRKNIRKPTQSP